MRCPQIRQHAFPRGVRRSFRLHALEIMEPRVLLANVTVISPADDATEGTLRWAILQVNEDSAPGTIHFNIPGEGVRVIEISSPLPRLTRAVEIDGTTQPGFSGVPLVTIDGRSAGPGAAGLVLTAGESTVRGLGITNFSMAGLVLQDGTGNLIQGNVIGVDPSGVVPQPNGDGVLILGSSSNTVGGITASAGNLISGNGGFGVRVLRTTQDASANLIAGNLIGTSADGATALGNLAGGIQISGGSANIIGGLEPGARNVVSGNLQNGIELVSGSAQTKILGNLVGVAADGIGPLGNHRHGILLSSASNNSIGGIGQGATNVISANLGDGIAVLQFSDSNSIEGNLIGTGLDRGTPLGNIGNGVSLGSSSNSVGGASSGAGNTIAFNGSGLIGAGVQLFGLVTGNTILSNSIHDNAGLGINLGSGPTPNHAPGQVPGPNNYQNYPVLTVARTNGLVTDVRGNLVGLPNSSYSLEYFWSRAGDPSGFGEGETLLGRYGVRTDDQGIARLNFQLAGLPPNAAVSATATDGAGNTSEFSPHVSVAAVTDLAVNIQATPDPVVDGDQLTYTVTVTNPGYLDAHEVVLTHLLPHAASVISMSATQGVLPELDGQTITAQMGTLAARSSATLTVVVGLPQSSGTAVYSSASVRLNEEDANPGDNSASLTTRVLPIADLGLTVDATATEVLLGDVLTWTLTVTNHGPSAAPGANLTLLSGYGLAIDSAESTSGEVSAHDGGFVANLGEIESGGQALVTVRLRGAVAGSFAVNATLYGDNFDPIAEDNHESATVTVLPVASLAVSIASDRPKSSPGQVVQIAITSINQGADATGVVLTTTLPAGLSYLSASTTGGAIPVFSAETRTLTLQVGNFSTGGVVTLLVFGEIQAPVGVSLVTTATISSEGRESDPSDNSSSCSVTVRDLSSLRVTIATDVDSVPIDGQLIYSMAVTNAGPADEPDARLSLPLPEDIRLLAMWSDQGPAPVFADGMLTASLGSIPVGSTVYASVKLSPSISELGLLGITASVLGQNVNPDPDFAQATATVLVTPTGQLAISIAPPAVAYEGVELTYRLRVVNNGPLPATDIRIASRLPDGVEFVSAGSAQGASTSFSNGVVTATLDELGVDESFELEIRVIPTHPFPSAAGMKLEGRVTSATYDPFQDDNVAGFALPVLPSNDLAVSLVRADNSRAVSLGDAFTLSAVVDNLGPSPATGVILSFPLNGSAEPASVILGGLQASLLTDVLLVPIGTVDVGERVIVPLTLIAAAMGQAEWMAVVSGNEFDLVTDNDQATAGMTILESPGALGFSSPLFSTDEAAGFIDVPVVRTRGARGTVSVNYRTKDGDATPGVDYSSVSGTLTFAEGETVKTIRIPILRNPNDRGDEYLGLLLDVPTNGAVLSSQMATAIRIRDLDPDLTPPQLLSLTFEGGATAITRITARFSEPVEAHSALAAASYQLADLGTGGQANPAVVTSIALSPIAMDPTGRSITLVPARPLPAGAFYRLVISGTGVSAVADLAGNPLAGSGIGQAGSDYVALFGRGTNVRYFDRDGEQVTLKVTGGGFLDLIRDADGEGQVLRLEAGVSGRTTISGSVTRANGRGIGRTSLETIEGLGVFGEIRVKLANPPFVVRQYPFFLNNGRPVRGRAQVKPAPRPLPVRAARPIRAIPQARFTAR